MATGLYFPLLMSMHSFLPLHYTHFDTHPHHVGDNGNTAQVEIMYLCWPSSQWKENNYSVYLDCSAWLYLFIWCNRSEITINEQSSSFLWNAVPEQVICFISGFRYAEMAGNVSLSVSLRLRCQRLWIQRTLWSRCVCQRWWAMRLFITSLQLRVIQCSQ